MGSRTRRRAGSACEQLELLGPRPRVPQWSGMPEGVRREVTRLLARMLGTAVRPVAGGGASLGEAGDE